jgi:hypothetical protein
VLPEGAEPIRGAAALAFAFGRLAVRAARFGAAAFFREAAGRFALIFSFAVDLRLAADGFLRAADFGLAEARRAEARPPVFFFFEEAREVFRPPPRPAFFAFIATWSLLSAGVRRSRIIQFRVCPGEPRTTRRITVNPASSSCRTRAV